MPLKTLRIARYTLGSIALACVITGGFLLAVSTASIAGSRADIQSEIVFLGEDGATPALHLRPPMSPGFGTVVVVHGFGASHEFMREMSYSVARGGFEVYAPDLPGHGRSGRRMDGAHITPWFGEILRDISESSRAPGGLYLVGHSLGTLLVTGAAAENPDLDIRAVIAVSPITSAVTADTPRNYLALFGQSELPGVRDSATKALALGTGLEAPELGRVYGDFALGTARGARMIPAASHMSIARDAVAIGYTLLWFHDAAGAADQDLPRLEKTGAERGFGLVGGGLLWMGLFLFLGGAAGLLGHAPRRPDTVALMLGDQADRERAAQLRTSARLVALFFALAAVITTAVAVSGWFTFLGQLVTEYVAPYLLVFALVMLPLLFLAGRPLKTVPLLGPSARGGYLRSAVAGLLLFALVFALIGLFGTYSMINLVPSASRVALIGLLIVMLAPFAVMDEMIRGTVHDRLGLLWGLFIVLIGKLIIYLSWYAAVILPNAPQGLIVAVSPLLNILIFIDLAGTFIYNEHGNWVAPAVFKTLTLAWLLGTVFPLVI